MQPTPRPAPATADLPAAYESLLDTVWQCEREWDLDDRIALAVRQPSGQLNRRGGDAD